MEQWKTFWYRIVSWSAWKRILFPHPALTISITAAAMSALLWVFLRGLENSILAYFLYPVCFYSLVIFLVLLCKGFPWLRERTKQDKLFQWVRNVGGGSAFDIGFYIEQIINFCYGGFKIITGFLLSSAWIGADGIYNFTQGTIQLYQILRHRDLTDKLDQWRVYHKCGWMMIFVNLTMTGMIFQMIHLGRHEENTEISIIGSAAFTFYKLLMAFVDVAKDRKHKNPVDSAVHFLNFGQALYNLFVLQVGLLWTFGGDAFEQHYLMNSLTGFAVCVLVCGSGVYMIWRANRDTKFLTEG